MNPDLRGWCSDSLAPETFFICVKTIVCLHSQNMPVVIEYSFHILIKYMGLHEERERGKCGSGEVMINF